MTFTVGLTGGIGSGKTAASDWFLAQGVHIVDADVVARQIVEPHQPALSEIQQCFGEWVLLPDGTLDRAALRQHIFEHPSARQQLETITHPKIRQEIIKQLADATSSYCILVSPLLIESKQHELVDRVLLIDVPEHLQLSRAGLRDAQSSEAIAKIMAVQMPRLHRQTHADDIAVNDGDLNHLYAQLIPLHEQYQLLARQRQG